MSLFKFGSLGASMNTVNNPRVQATAATKNGYVFKITDNYTSGGSKSKVVIVVGSDTIADGVVQFNIGGQNIYTTIVALTQDTDAKVAALIKTNCDAVLLGLGYTVAIDTATLTITAPAVGSSTSVVLLDNISVADSTVTLTPTYTAGTDATAYKEAAVPSANDAGAKADKLYVAMNIIDTPELWNQADFVIPAGSYIRAFNLNDLVGYPVELSSDLVTTAYGSVAVGEFLVPVPAGANAMMWKKATDTGYACVLKVIEKTTFGGTGLYCKITNN